MSEMIERVARAIHESSSKWPWAGMSNMNKDDRRKDARAAIEAMREPTEEIRDAWAAHAARTDGAASARGYHDAMIDASIARKGGAQ